MAVIIANTEITQTFDYWRNRTNELAWTMSKVVLTTDGSLAPLSLVGNSIAIGNTTITGTFFANQFTSNSRVTVKDSIYVNTASEVNGAITSSFAIINTTTISIGNVTSNSVLTNSSLTTSNLFIGSSVLANTSTIFVGDASSNNRISKSNITLQSTGVVNSTINSISVVVSNNSVNSTLTYDSLVIGNTTVNSTIVSAGAGVFTADATNLNANGLIVNSSGAFVTNTSGVVNAAVHQVGTAFTANSTLVNTAAINIVGRTNTATLFVTTSANIASSNIVANSAGLFIANSTGVINAASHTVGTAFTANATVVNAVSYYAGTTLIGNTTGPYGKTESNLNVNSALTSNNSTYLNGQLASYYLNATNITTGTLAWAQAPTGTVNTSGSFTLSGNTTLAGTTTVISSNVNMTGAFVNVGTLVNTAAINVRGQSNTNTLFVTSLATIGGNTVISGTWANVTGDLRVMGNLIVNGSVTYTANASGDIIPSSNNDTLYLGNTTNRWGLNSYIINNVGNVTSNNVNVTLTVNAANHTVGSDFIANSTGVYHTSLVNAASYRAGNVTTGSGGSLLNSTTMLIGNNTINTVITSAGLNINAVTVANSSGLYTSTVNASIIRTGGGFSATANGVYIDSDDIWIGNSSVSSTVNATFYSKTANNTSYVGTTPAASVVNSIQLSANLSNYAALAGANFTGAVQVSNNVTITGNLIVSGTTVTVNTQTLDVKDLNITLAKGVGTAALSDGAGITIDTSNIGLYYHFSSNTWQSNVGFTPSSNNSHTLGTTGLRWSAIFANNITLTNSVSASLVSATNVSATDIYGTVKTATQATIDHNSLANYDANRHIDHTAVSISAGNGLTGGGTIAATRTLTAVGANGISVTASGINVLANNGVVSNSSGVFVLGNTGIVSNSSGVFANAAYIQSLVNVSNGSVTTSGTSAQDIDNFVKATYLGAEYLISVSDNAANNKYVTKTLVMHDGASAQITEYGSITSNSAVGVFSATQNTTHVILQFTPSLSATTVKYTRTVV